jgi:ribose transport system substrate-binding protein
MAGAPRVLVSLFDEAQEYQRLQGTEAQATAARLGVEAEVVYANRESATQARQIAEAVKLPEGRRPSAVVVQPLAVGALEAAARAALQAGVGWVSLDPATYLDGLRRAYPDRLVAVLTADGLEMGRLQAHVFRALLPRGGRVVCLEGPALSPPVVQRREGLRAGLRGSGVEVVKTLYGDWSEESGENAVALWVRLGTAARPDLLGAQNDAMAAGARAALQKWMPAWLDLPITGCDGLPSGGQRLVRQKILAATVVQPTTAGAAIELVARALRGEQVPNTTSLPPRAYPPVEELVRRARG